jgi:hypothetical protein
VTGAALVLAPEHRRRIAHEADVDRVGAERTGSPRTIRARTLTCGLTTCGRVGVRAGPGGLTACNSPLSQADQWSNGHQELITMGIFGMRRHHLQNQANRATIAAHRTQQAADKAAGRAKLQREAALGRNLVELKAKEAAQTPEDRAREFESYIERNEIKGDIETAENFRLAAQVIRRMVPEEWTGYQEARQKYDGRAGANALAYFARTGKPTPWAPAENGN